MVKVFPGEFYVTRQPDEILVTVLGSCVSACIRDPVLGVGGMNHFMLANGRTGAGATISASARFGNFAMEKLINELIKAGCSRDRMEIKVFGGGNVIDASTRDRQRQCRVRPALSRGRRVAMQRRRPGRHRTLGASTTIPRRAASYAGCSEPAKPTRSAAKSGNTRTGCGRGSLRAKSICLETRSNT